MCAFQSIQKEYIWYFLLMMYSGDVESAWWLSSEWLFILWLFLKQVTDCDMWYNFCCWKMWFITSFAKFVYGTVAIYMYCNDTSYKYGCLSMKLTFCFERILFNTVLQINLYIHHTSHISKKSLELTLFIIICLHFNTWNVEFRVA